MTKTTPTKRNKEQTKQNLLISARQLFINQGIGNTTIEHISSNAGYTRGAFYSTFTTKDELIHTLIEQEFSKLVEKYSQNLLSLTTRNTQNFQPEEAIEQILVKLPLNQDFHILRTELYLYAIRTTTCQQVYKDAMRYTKMAFSQILIEYLDKMKLTLTVTVGDLVDIMIATINATMHNNIITDHEEEYKSQLAASMFPKILKASTKNLIE